MNLLYTIIILIVISCTQGNKNIINDKLEITGVIVKKEDPKSEFNSEINDSAVLKRKIVLKGTINKTIKITMYLNEQEHPCGGSATVLNAMYKYDNQDKWMLLDVTTDAKKQKYCMVENNFTGVLFLEENKSHFAGHWLSPDTKKQYNVLLENMSNKSNLGFDKKVIEKLDEILFDDLIYNKNDC